MTDQVQLTMPAAPEYVRLARLTAAGLASRIGFDYDEVEDVRIGIDELCYLLVGGEGAGTLTLTYTVGPDELVIEGAGEGAGLELSPMSERILSVVADAHEVSRDSGRLRFRLVRRRAGEAP